jgi:hypothetical protein
MKTYISVMLAVIFFAKPSFSQTALSPEQESNLKRQGNILLSKWIDCEIRSANTIAQKTTLASEDVAGQAQQSCSSERGAWIESQTALGWPRYAAEQTADGSERCSFPIIVASVDMTRRHASQAERQEWANAHANISCGAEGR